MKKFAPTPLKPKVSVGTPRVVKLVLASVLLAAVATQAAQASTRLVAAPACDEPVPIRTYDGKAMTYGISVDLSHCAWWDGSAIQLEATLSRLDGTGEEGSTTVVLCGGRVLGEEPSSQDSHGEAIQDDDAPGADEDAAHHDDGEGHDPNAGGHVASASDDQRTQSSTCEVATALEHPSVEVACYQGEVTYPWRNGPRTVGFTALCASPGSVCREDR